MVRLTHQLTPTTPLHNLRSGTPTVYINEIGAEILHHHRRISHPRDIVPEDLNAIRSLLLGEPHHLHRSLGAPRHALHRHELAHHESNGSGIQLLHQSSKWTRRHPAHRRKYESRIYLNSADPIRLNHTNTHELF